MSISESSQRKWPVQWPMPNEYTLLAAVAVGLLIFHIIFAVTLMPASANGPATSQEEALLRLCD
jgi:hypothetical protein